MFERTLAAALKSVENSGHEIIVINDSKTAEVTIPNSVSSVSIFNNPNNGVASARNLGVKKAKHSLLLFLDDDILISANGLSSAIDFILKHPASALNLNWIYPPELSTTIEHTKFGRYLIQKGFTSLKGWQNGSTWKEDAPFRCNLISSYFLMIRKDNFETIGGYDERFPYAGAEDFEFAKRLNSCGITPYIDPHSIVFHNESDRVQMKPWLIRKQRSAQTRRLASEMGHQEVAISSSKRKVKILLQLYPMHDLLQFIHFLIPNIRLFDKISFRLIDILVALNLYKGYFNKQES